MASRFEPVTDPDKAWEYRQAGVLYWRPNKILAYLEADMLYYTRDGKVGKSYGGHAHGPYGEYCVPAIQENMRHCTYGILVEEDAEQTDSIYG